MGLNVRFIKRTETQAWLGQFAPQDQAIAQSLLQSMLLVSRDAFLDRLKNLILERAQTAEKPIGLFAEREVKHYKGVPHRLFKESRTKVKRAFGNGPAPVKSVREYDHDVGSEGLVANLISELCREYPKLFFNHPGPTNIRKNKIRRFFIITDFIGSGDRVAKYLKAAWRVRSVRSWWSSKEKGAKFEILTYSGTELGKKAISNHSSLPQIHSVITCPTVKTSFNYEKQAQIRELCVQYNPTHIPADALGYGDSGALIAFAHGVPNNAPLIFYKKSSTWLPLFPARSTAQTRGSFHDDRDPHVISERLIKLRRQRLAHSNVIQGAMPYAQDLFLLLASFSRPPRTDEATSGKTGFTILEVQQLATEALKLKLIDSKRHLTEYGQSELTRASKIEIFNESASHQSEKPYYPTSLRAP